MKKALKKSIIFLAIFSFFIVPVFSSVFWTVDIVYAALPPCSSFSSENYKIVSVDGDSYAVPKEGGDSIPCEDPEIIQPSSRTTTTGTTSGANTNPSKPQSLPAGGIDIKCSTDSVLVGCIFYPIWRLTLRVTAYAAVIFDVSLFATISSGSYKDMSIMSEGWTIIRDLVNIIFIFALLYIAFAIMLGISSVNVRRSLIKLILAAIFINFSLFISYAIIDSGNILAHIFYNKITVNAPGPSASGKALVKYNRGGEKDIALAIASKSNPQSIINQMLPSHQVDNANMLFIIIMAIAVNIMLIYTFLSLFLYLILRTLMLWVYAIFSPIAFVSYVVPGGAGIFGDFDQKKWWAGILGNAFMAPILLFFIYIIIKFLNIGANSVLHIVKTGNLIIDMLSITMPLIITIILLGIAKKTTKKLAGEMAGGIVAQVSKYGKMATGAVVGIASGGAALAGRATIGRTASSFAKSERMSKWAAKSKFGRFTQSTLEKTGKQTFDVRGAKVFGKGFSDLTGKTGIGMVDKPIKSFAVKQKDFEKKKKKQAKALKVGPNEKLGKEKASAEKEKRIAGKDVTDYKNNNKFKKRERMKNKVESNIEESRRVINSKDTTQKEKSDGRVKLYKNLSFLEKLEKPIRDLENTLKEKTKDVKDVETKIKTENKERTENFVKSDVEGFGSKVFSSASQETMDKTASDIRGGDLGMSVTDRSDDKNTQDLMNLMKSQNKAGGSGDISGLVGIMTEMKNVMESFSKGEMLRDIKGMNLDKEIARKQKENK